MRQLQFQHSCFDKVFNFCGVEGEAFAVQKVNNILLLFFTPASTHINHFSRFHGYTADLLNAGIGEGYSAELDISPDAESTAIECDARLVSRAVSNLVQNSISHNPQGCNIILRLDCADNAVLISVADNGVGLSAEKLRELEEKPHYMESTDERLDLRHGLGLLLVRQIMAAHGGTMEIESRPQNGCKTVLMFKRPLP